MGGPDQLFEFGFSSLHGLRRIPASAYPFSSVTRATPTVNSTIISMYRPSDAYYGPAFIQMKKRLEIRLLLVNLCNKAANMTADPSTRSCDSRLPTPNGDGDDIAERSHIRLL